MFIFNAYETVVLISNVDLRRIVQRKSENEEIARVGKKAAVVSRAYDIAGYDGGAKGERRQRVVGQR